MSVAGDRCNLRLHQDVEDRILGRGREVVGYSRKKALLYYHGPCTYEYEYTRSSALYYYEIMLFCSFDAGHTRHWLCQLQAHRRNLGHACSASPLPKGRKGAILNRVLDLGENGQTLDRCWEWPRQACTHCHGDKEEEETTAFGRAAGSWRVPIRLGRRAHGNNGKGVGRGPPSSLYWIDSILTPG